MNATAGALEALSWKRLTGKFRLESSDEVCEMTAAVTIDLDEGTLSALDALAARLDRPRDALVGEALAEWLAFQRGQIEKIEAGLAAADRGEFASDEEVARVVAKYGVTW